MSYLAGKICCKKTKNLWYSNTVVPRQIRPVLPESRRLSCNGLLGQPPLKKFPIRSGSHSTFFTIQTGQTVV